MTHHPLMTNGINHHLPLIAVGHVRPSWGSSQNHMRPHPPGAKRRDVVCPSLMVVGSDRFSKDWLLVVVFKLWYSILGSRMGKWLTMVCDKWLMMVVSLGNNDGLSML